MQPTRQENDMRCVEEMSVQNFVRGYIYVA